MKFIFGLLASYLLGSIPTAYILGKAFKGIDIREHGSGNVGATNVFRVMGKGPGIVVLMCDIVKGALAVAMIPDLLGLTGIIHRVAMALMVVIGHNWTVFLNFRGGKGIATSLGVLIGLTIRVAAIRPVLLWTVAVWATSFIFTGFVSLASMIASFFLPMIMVWTNQPIEMICLGVIFCIFVTLRHRLNIKRLLAGQEPRVFSVFKKQIF
jgi:glycerol-3-phosphate acyltransferase PlsY